jgi:hypothetical protein
MIVPAVRPLPCRVILALVLAGWVSPFTRAEEPAAQSPPEQLQAPQAVSQDKPKTGEDAGTQAKPNESQGNRQSAGGNSGQNQQFDQAVVASGQAAFERSCTKCHDAARSLDRTKDLAGWRTTVRRMAGKRDADIAQSDIEPIAVYLASRTSGGGGAGGAAGGGATGGAAGGAAPSSDLASSIATFATVSPIWRGGNNDLQNNGFGALAWIGASWQGKIVSVRATACISCHGVKEPGQISRIEPAEVAVHVDLSTYFDQHCKGMKGSVDAGRFIVPFGAFSATSDPSLYRTVSTPLIFNMGQRLFDKDIGFPVLPMPYADEGINLNIATPCLFDCGTGPVTITADGYLVNGLEGTTNGIDFYQSRDLYDNNNRVAGGTRVTIGDPYVRAGASFMSGRYDTPTPGLAQGLYYTIYGFDIQAKYKRLFRAIFEYARRDTDVFGQLPSGPSIFNEGVYGYYAEAEVRPCGEKSHWSLLTRYDWQAHNSMLPPSGSSLVEGHYHVERLTFGVNVELWHQSLLMFDYERWLTPEPFHRTSDIFGIRYTITF